MHWLICGPDLQIYRFWILTLLTFWNFWIVHEIGFGYLDNISEWTKSKKMKMNEKKTKAMIFN